MKRLLDVGVSALALLLLSPLIALVVLAIRLSLGAPVLFRQVRPGYQARPFTILKFRTMKEARGADGELLPDAERLAGAGRLVRRLSLDELPQLWNVLRGDMSLVGPRPLLLEYLDRYSPEQARRHEVRPGITGWAQIHGRNAITWEQKFALDVWYVGHRSLWLDVRILAATVWRVLTRHGVSQEGHATMPHFMGNADSNHAHTGAKG